MLTHNMMQLTLLRINLMKPIIRPLFIAIILISIIFHLTVADPAVAQSTSTNSEQLVSIDFNNVDLVVFIKFMSDLTKKNFIIDDKVKGKVTMRLKNVPWDQALDLLVSTYGLGMVIYSKPNSGKSRKYPKPEGKNRIR